MGKDWLFSELLLLEKHWEWEPSTVLSVHFLNFNTIVAQEVVKTVELVATIVTVVLPQDFERKNLAIVIKETLKVLVRAATFQLDLVVVFVLCQIRRVLFHVDHGSCVSERIVWEVLWDANVNTFIRVESLGEFVTINDAENSGVDIKVAAEF